MKPLTVNRGFLKEGQIVDLGGDDGHCEVVLVNDCRAACVPLTRRSVEIKKVGDEGKPVKFMATRSRFNLSPTSEVPILARSRAQYVKRGGELNCSRSRHKDGNCNDNDRAGRRELAEA